MIMVTIKIYYLINPLNGSIFYIGRTTNLQGRLSGHICNNSANSKKGDIIKEIISNELLPLIEEIDSIDCRNEKDEEYANKMEDYWINQMKSWGFPITNVSGLGYKYVKRTQIKWEHHDNEYNDLIDCRRSTQKKLGELEYLQIPPIRDTPLGRKVWQFDLNKAKNDLMELFNTVTKAIKAKQSFYHPNESPDYIKSSSIED